MRRTFSLILAASLAAAAPATAPTENPTVEIQNLSFRPDVIRIRRGQTVTWINRDDFLHTATADDESFDTRLIREGGRSEVRFEEAGTFRYHCVPHPFMKATVIVEEH